PQQIDLRRALAHPECTEHRTGEDLLGSWHGIGEREHLLCPHVVVVRERRCVRADSIGDDSVGVLGLLPRDDLDAELSDAGRFGRRPFEGRDDHEGGLATLQDQTRQPLERLRVIAREIAQIGSRRDEHRVDAAPGRVVGRMDKAKVLVRCHGASVQADACIALSVLLAVAIPRWQDRHMAETANRLLLLDTASLYFRAFYGVPDSLRAPDGTPVNALRGLLDFVARLVADYRPDALAACWDDDWRPAWRVELLPTYKAHRVEEEVRDDPDVEETPDLLSPQVPLIAEALTLLGIAVVGAEEYEADDVIGTLSRRWDGPVDIVTGDRDLFQLVDDARGRRVLYTARGVGKHEQI